MSRTAVGCWIAVAVAFLIGIILLSAIVGVWNNLNAKHQAVQGARSHYSAALNTCTEKIEGVWAMSQQYLDHESGTFKGVAEARSGFLRAKELFQQLEQSGTSPMELTKVAMLAQQMFGQLQKAGGLAINVSVEAYPQLRGAETTLRAQRTMEEGVNEIKTALDDWVSAIKDYNTYRGYAWPSIAGSLMGRFPREIEYYQGDVTKLDIDQLSPVRPQAETD